MKLLIIVSLLISMNSFAKEVVTECLAMNEAKAKIIKLDTKAALRKKTSLQ